MQELTDLAFLATYATLSVAAFAFLQHLVVPPVRQSMKDENASADTELADVDHW